MSRSVLWHEFESGEGVLLRALRFLILAGGLVFLCYTAVLPLPWKRQMLFAGITVAIALAVNRGSKAHLGTLTLLLLSVYSTCRYGFWRAAGMVAFLRDPLSHWTGTDATCMFLLLAAECYAIASLILGYIQVLWPLRRLPVPLPDDPADWPVVDLLIPTYDEPLAVLRPTALAAMNIDWPAEKLNVYILDDGAREQVRAFAEEAGVGYIARSSRMHAKAGNINHGLRQMQAPYVAVFDCDHVPTRSFLQLTMGWMLRDQKLAMLQTPHHFYSPDPFERNLNQFRAVPSEGELYYRVLQDGNDFWNAACFCGSSSVLRRSALDQIGGFAVETVTEDAHTSLRLQVYGWNTAYINIPQAAGLAAERLSGYIRQRVRWARGMLHVLRLENPLLAPGLTLGQRLCYFHAMAYFLFAVPRLIFLTAPLMYLVFGRMAMPGFWAAIVAYALPHLILSGLCKGRIQREHRHAFWDHVYETVLAPFLLLPTLRTLLSPGSQEFDVTRKGGVVDRGHFDGRVAWPFLFLLASNLLGILLGFARLVRFHTLPGPSWLLFLNWPARLYAPHQAGVVAVNLVWAFFNVILLGVATGVARETQQRREAVRLSVSLPSDVILPDGSMLQGVTCDLSNGGVRARVEGTVQIRPGEPVSFVFPLLDGTATFTGFVVGLVGDELRARFESVSLQQHEALATLLYSRADSWLNWTSNPAPRHPLRSFADLLRLSLRGLGVAARTPRKSPLASSIAPLLLLAALAAAPRSSAQSDTTPEAPAAAPPRLHHSAPRDIAPAINPVPGFNQVLRFAELGWPADQMLRGSGSSQRLHFFIPGDRLVKAATVTVRYQTSPAMLPGLSHLIVSLNGTVVSTLPVSANGNGPSQVAVPLPVEQLKHDNRLAFELIGQSSAQCPDPANPAVWAQIDPASTLELSGSALTMTADLASLPLPFYDLGGESNAVVPLVFLGQPSLKAMQAAAVVASWFGTLAGSRPVRFPVSVGVIPRGNVILLAEGGEVPEPLREAIVPGAEVAIHANPFDPASKVLILRGDDGDHLLVAARALVLHQSTWQGPRVIIRNFVMPGPRQPDDAPRWLRTDSIQRFGALARTAAQGESRADPVEAFQTDGSTPVTVPLALPPDLDFADRENLPLRLDYRYNSVAVGEGSTLQVFANGAYVSSTPMPHADKASRVLETIVPIPVADLRPFSNTLEFRFLFVPRSDSGCANQPAHNFEGAIVPDSSLDISGISHWAVLPNLQLFASAGFPFTRVADLAASAIVLPDKPTIAELETFLLLMGGFGSSTGYPVLRVTVTNAAGMAADRASDYLVLGTRQDQPALQNIGDSMPIRLDGSGMHIRDTGGRISYLLRWGRPRNPHPQDQLIADAAVPDALIQEFNWPAHSSRTVVAITLRSDDAAPEFAEAFLGAARSADIRQSVSVLRGERFSSYDGGAAEYRVGTGTLLERWTRTLQRFPWLIAVVAAIFCFLIAVLLQARLRRRAHVRLHGTE